MSEENKKTVSAKWENPILTVFVSGRVDTTNAAETEEQINLLCAEHETDDLVLDLDKLEYISSVGLRMVLRLRKMKSNLKIVNASPEVYDIFEMTGFTEMIPVEKAYRKMSVEGCRVIGRGAKGTVYRYNDDTIVKVYHNPDCLPDIQRERDLARKAFVLGIPTAISYDIVKVGDSFGSVFELLDAKPYSQLIAESPAEMPRYVADCVKLLKLIHQTEVKPEDMPNAKETAVKWVAATKPYVSEEVYGKVSAFVEALPDTTNMIHGDFHTNNIMMQKGETLLIDMDTLSHGNPMIELANIHFTYAGFTEVDPTNVEQFLGIPADLATKVWDVFFDGYTEGMEQDEKRTLSDGVKLLSYARVLRHIARRDAESETAKANIASLAAKIGDLTAKMNL